MMQWFDNIIYKCAKVNEQPLSMQIYNRANIDRCLYTVYMWEQGTGIVKIKKKH